MVDFLKKWIWGIGCAWGGFGAVAAYIHFKGPLPDTQKYLDQKYKRRLPLLEKLDELDSQLPEILLKRKYDREQWRKQRLTEEAKPKGGVT